MPCARCGLPSRHQWSTCANGNRYLGVCARCDIALNRLALKFFRFPLAEREELMRRYVAGLAA